MGKLTRALLASMLALALCGCASTADQTSSEDDSAANEVTAGETASEAQPADVGPQLVSVKVVDKVRESINGTSFSDYWLETAYEYDENARLVGTSQSTNYPQSTRNLAKGIFDYDAAGRLVKASQAYEQYGWNVGNATTFTYDDQGICTSCAFEVVSQGNGSTSLQYTYAEGRIAQAVETDVIRPDTNSFSLSWTYTDDGHISKVISGAGGEAGFGLVEELSDPAQGVYAYRDVYDGLTTLKFNDDGSLASVTTRAASGSSLSQNTYEYKTITVDAATYTPNVYTNPTGFDPKWKPQVTLAEAPQTPATDAS